MGKFLKAAADDLALHVRQRAWLYTAPDKAAGDKDPAPAVSRLQSLRAYLKEPDFDPELPDEGTAAYLLDHFWNVGPTTGDHVITQDELAKYQSNAGIELSPWECATLRRLSIEHINESQRARENDCSAPWNAQDYPIDRILAAKRQRDAMRSVAAI